jgi:hypothetical protein
MASGHRIRLRHQILAPHPEHHAAPAAAAILALIGNALPAGAEIGGIPQNGSSSVNPATPVALMMRAAMRVQRSMTAVDWNTALTVPSGAKRGRYARFEIFAF